ncbi:unnamed protein product [Prunus brigantina]
MENSSLGGKINPSLLSLKHLSYLDLSRNDFQGIPIPTFFGQLESLRYLNISRASFGGEIPAHLGQIPQIFGNFCNLKTLNLANNQFEGGIQELLGGFSSCPNNELESLDLSSNKLKSQLPASVGMLHNLKYLNLYNNDMSGSIPKSKVFPRPTLPIPLIFNVSYEWVPPFKLHKINVGNCKVGPAFGAWLQSQTELVFVKLPTTGISDSIPEDWFLKLSSQVEYLDLSANQIHGKLPLQLKLPNALLLDLGHNNLMDQFHFGLVTMWLSLSLKLIHFLAPFH